MDKKEYCANYMKKCRQYRKENSLCAVCGCEVEQGKYRCDKCNEKHNASYKKNYNAEKMHDKYKRHREKYKAEHRCQYCGVYLPEDRNTICVDCQQKHNERSRKDYAYYQQIGVCPRCRKEKIFKDEKMCPECKAKSANFMYQKMQTVDKDAFNAHRREREKARRDRLREQGLCTNCGKEIEDKKYSRCQRCRVKFTQRANDSRHRRATKSKREIWIEQGLCVKCGGERYKDFKLCKPCYDKMLEITHCDNAISARRMMKDVYGW